MEALIITVIRLAILAGIIVFFVKLSNRKKK